MYQYIFFVHHITQGNIYVTVRADSREEARDYVENSPDFVKRKSEPHGIVVMTYDAR